MILINKLPFNCYRVILYSSNSKSTACTGTATGSSSGQCSEAK